MKAFLSLKESSRMLEMIKDAGVSEKEQLVCKGRFTDGMDCEGVGPLTIVVENKLFLPNFNETWFNIEQPAIIKPKPGLMVPGV